MSRHGLPVVLDLLLGLFLFASWIRMPHISLGRTLYGIDGFRPVETLGR